MMTIKALSLLTRDNHRIVEWKIGASHGKVIAGDRDEGNRLDQLYLYQLMFSSTKRRIVSSLLMDGNGRVLRWSRRQDTTQGELIIDNISC